ncbi:hypothetical protein BTS2_0971 [Bacillus sp. TS-2]|nr:hypothetical protein BTS2_0971 [Bacillus sp. TS-2]
MNEINLLPEKRKRDITPFVILFFLCCYLFLILVLTNWQSKKAEAEYIENEQLLNDVVLESEDIHSLDIQASTSIDQNWEAMTNYFEQELPYLPDLLEEVTNALPKGGNFLELKWSSPAGLEIFAKFTERLDVMSFQYQLNQLSITNVVWIESLERDNGEENYKAIITLELMPEHLQKMGERR